MQMLLEMCFTGSFLAWPFRLLKLVLYILNLALGMAPARQNQQGERRAPFEGVHDFDPLLAVFAFGSQSLDFQLLHEVTALCVQRASSSLALREHDSKDHGEKNNSSCCYASDLPQSKSMPSL